MDSVNSGTFGHCPVAPDALQGIKRQQTNPARWNGARWNEFAAAASPPKANPSRSAACCST